MRLRLDHMPALIDRGMLFAAAQHAFGLYRWFAAPDAAQREAIQQATDHLETVGGAHSPLIGAAIGVHAWLDAGGERPPIRAALALYWQRRGVTALPCPLLTGVQALGAETPWAREAWIGHFLAALAQEAADGLALLAQLERHWFAARAAVAGRRRNSRAAAAIDILAAAPLVSATTLGQALGMATNNATRLLDGFVVLGVASEVTHRSKRRLYGLKHLAPLREAAAPPRRPVPGRRRGRPSVASLLMMLRKMPGELYPLSRPPLRSHRSPGANSILPTRPLVRPDRSGNPACATSARGTPAAAGFWDGLPVRRVIWGGLRNRFS